MLEDIQNYIHYESFFAGCFCIGFLAILISGLCDLYNEWEQLKKWRDE